MARKKRRSEENARREKTHELLQMENIGSMDDIQNLFKETIAEFMENVLEAGVDDELGVTANTITKTETQTTAVTDTAVKRYVPALEMYRFLKIEKGGGI